MNAEDQGHSPPVVKRLPKIGPQVLKECSDAQGNGYDGAHAYMKDGAFVAITCWPTMRGKIADAKSAQGLNDREFYETHVPEDTKILVRVTKREVFQTEKKLKGQDGLATQECVVFMKSIDNWMQADDLVVFDASFGIMYFTEEGKEYAELGEPVEQC